MKILDKYIIKTFLSTLFFIVAILASVSVIIDISQKLARIEDSGSSVREAMINFYPFWVIWLANTFLPIAVFISVIYFTSRLTAQSEITGILAGGISFNRFAKPYLMSAALIAFFSLMITNIVLPWVNIKKNKYQYEHMLATGAKNDYYKRQSISSQISPNEYIFVESYDRVEKEGRNFEYQKIDSFTLKEQINAWTFDWNKEKSTYKLRNVYIRKLLPDGTEHLEHHHEYNKKLGVTPDEILPEGYVAETMNSFELYEFINNHKKKGSASVNVYENELQQRNSLPFSVFILTILAMAISSKVRRGGIGVNLAVGIVLAFMYIFFNQASLIYSEQGHVSPFVAAWAPNILFGCLTLILYIRRARS